MTKAEEFKKAVKKLEMDTSSFGIKEETEYMSDMDNWCIVHATSYLPISKPDGTMYIPSSAMATDFEIPRSTIHVTLNYIVEAHLGSWDDKPIVILAPYNDVAEKNGNPAELASMDTYWSVNPDKGLVLPESAYIVKPDNNGPLFQIDEHGATYKRDNYTEEEIEQILSMLNPSDREKYTRYKEGDITQQELNNQFFLSDVVKKAYENAKDKKAFLRGLFEEAKFDVLSRYLRDAVVRLSMQKIGKQYMDFIRDANDVSQKIASVASEHGIPANANDKGHSNSPFSALEDVDDGTDLFATTDVHTIYDMLTQNSDIQAMQAVLLNLVDGKPIDFYKIYQDRYNSYMRGRMTIIQGEMEHDQTEYGKYLRHEYEGVDEEENNKWIKIYEDRLPKYQQEMDELSAKKTIDDCDKNLDETIRRHCQQLTKKYDAWHAELAKKPEYENLVQKLRAFEQAQIRRRAGHDEY